METTPPRFGFRNLGALLGLAAWCWYASSAGPELGFPGQDLGSLTSGLARQALWFTPIGLLVPLALPRMRGILAVFFFVLLPSLALGAVLTVLVALSSADTSWWALEALDVPELLSLLVPLAGMFPGVLLGTILARGLRSALVTLAVVAAIGAALLAIVAVAFLLLTDQTPVAAPLGASAAEAERRTLSVESHSADSLMGARMAAAWPEVSAASGLDPGLRLELAMLDDNLEVRASFPFSAPLFGERFVNLILASQPSVEDGTFRAGLRSFRVGVIPFPSAWVRGASRAFSRWLDDSPVGPMIEDLASAHG